MPASDQQTIMQAQTISPKEIIKPNMPIGIFCQEAYDTYYLAQGDKELLCGRGIDWSIVDDIPARIGYLHDQEARLNSLPYSETPLKREYTELAATAKATMRDLFETLTYASGEDKEIIKAIRAIKRGKTDSDFLSDVYKARALLDEQKHILDKTKWYDHFRISLDTCASRIVIVYAELQLESGEESGAVSDRNRAYTHLFRAVDELRRCARVALANNPRRLRGYTSDYFRKKTKKKRSPRGQLT